MKKSLRDSMLCLYKSRTTMNSLLNFENCYLWTECLGLFIAHLIMVFKFANQSKKNIGKKALFLTVMENRNVILTVGLIIYKTAEGMLKQIYMHKIYMRNLWANRYGGNVCWINCVTWSTLLFCALANCWRITFLTIWLLCFFLALQCYIQSWMFCHLFLLL